MARYLRKRIGELSGSKSIEAIARESGYSTSTMIELFMSGGANVPLDKIAVLARALRIQLIPFTRLAFEQYGPEMTDIATMFGPRAGGDEYAPNLDQHPVEEERPAAEPSPRKASAAPAPSEKSAGTDAPYTSFVDLNFKVSPEFHRQFRIKAATEGLSMKDLMLLSFQAYLERPQ